MANGQINILDIGSGPAVASLAITDLTTSIARATGMKKKYV
jgi:tRNA1(Val) A37 N6-methylase TrmN6